MPSLALGWARSTTPAESREAALRVPLYHDVTREQLLVEITLPIREDPDLWILAGIAMFLSDAL